MDVGYSEFRQHLKHYFDLICENKQPIRVKRQNGGDVYVVSEEMFKEFRDLQQLNRLMTYMEKFNENKE